MISSAFFVNKMWSRCSYPSYVNWHSSRTMAFLLLLNPRQSSSYHSHAETLHTTYSKQWRLNIHRMSEPIAMNSVLVIYISINYILNTGSLQWNSALCLKSATVTGLLFTRKKGLATDIVRCRYNAVNFLQFSHKRHSIARLWGRGMDV